MITLDDYKMGRDKQFPSEWTDEVEANAVELLRRVNALLEELGYANPVVSSGFRPAAVNAATAGSAKHSNHMMGLAIDIRDEADQPLANVLLNTLELLEKHELWMESPDNTKGKYTPWVHLQSVSPRSGNRVFIA